MTSSDNGKNAEKTDETPLQTADNPAVVAVAPAGVGGIKQPRQVRSETLLHGDRELQIIHGDEIYRLSVTRQGKLILHK
jgi:hemin uptake protein HemP